MSKNDNKKIKEEFLEFAEYITNEKNWKYGKPYYKGYIYVTVLNAFWSWFNQKLKEQRQEIIKEIEGMKKETLVKLTFFDEDNYPVFSSEKFIETDKLKNKKK